MTEAGKIRQSSALTTFGPGALVDFVHGSFMPMGPDFWNIGPNNRPIHELDLQRHLGVSRFFAPPHEATDGFIKAKRFPEWLVCTNRRCCRLGTVTVPNRVPPDPHEAFTVNPVTGVVRCNSCNEPTARGNPTRFLCACTSRIIEQDANRPGEDKEGATCSRPTGHLSDFPWDAWCHQGMERDPNQRHILHLLEGDGLSFDSMRVKCSCQGENHRGTSMDGIFSGPLKFRDPFQGNQLKYFKCPGSSPWLGSMKWDCKCSTRVVQRGATSLHQPVTTTFVSIPPITNDIHKDIEKYLENFITFWNGIQLMVGLKADPVAAAQAYYNGQMLPLGFPAHHQAGTVTQILVDHATSGQVANSVPQNMSSRKDQEFDMLRQEQGSPSLDFQTEDAFGPGVLHGGIEKAMFVRRLREVTALQGFRREVPGSAQPAASQGANARGNAAPADQNQPPDFTSIFIQNGHLYANGRPLWLPAINLFGEGIFIQLSVDLLNKLVQETGILDRVGTLTSRLAGLEAERGYATRFSTTWDLSPFLGDPKLMARLLVAHTLCHLLIRELTLECGYSSASLKERIYASPNSFGFLIYSTTPGADGTRGGLVRMAAIDRFRPIFQNAIEKARWCSSDPICGTTNGQGTESLNLGACHGCALIPETSCELRNQFLDRCLITKSLSAGVPGFFC